MAHKNEIASLVSLLGDPDPYVQGEVKKRLFELGEQAVPLLDEQKSTTKDDRERARINDIIRDITAGSIEQDFIDILEGGLHNLRQLERAVFTLSRLENPTLRLKDYQRRLDRFARAIRDEIRFQPDETKQMHRTLSYIFEESGFSAGTSNYYGVDNALLDRVLDRRRGLPISLSFIVLFVARRLDLPFHGVNMPVHFLLKFRAEREEILIDPFDHGKTISYNQCYFFLKQNGIDPKPVHFQIASNPAMLARMINNLIRSYERAKQLSKAGILKELLQTLEMLCL